MKTHLFKFAIFLLIIFVFTACEQNDSPVDENDDKTFILNNVAASHASRIHKKNEKLVINQISNSKFLPQQTVEYDLTLIAEVSPPEFENQQLRATHIEIIDNFVFVSYNKEGDDYLGGVEVFDVSNPDDPQIVSQIIFPNTDISSLCYSNNKLFLAGAEDIDVNSDLETPAIIKEIELQNNILTENIFNIDVVSYVATGVSVNSDKIFATSGDNGGLSVLDINSFAPLAEIDINNARYVIEAENIIYVLKAMPAKLLTFDSNSGNTISELEIGGANLPDSKSTLEIKGNYAYMAVGEAGMKIVNLSTMQVVAALEKPETPFGYPDSEFVTNAVTENNNKLFIANGTAGVYVANYENEAINLLGSITVSGSANYVKSSGNFLFVATGAGGLQIITLEETVVLPNLSMSFDGDDDYVHIDNNEVFNLQTGGTLETWIFIESFTKYGGIIHKGDYAPQDPNLPQNELLLGDEAYSLQLWRNGAVRFIINAESNSQLISQYVETAPLSVNQWYHIAVSFGAEGISLYLNGNLVAVNQTVITPRITSGGINIGAQLVGNYNSYYKNHPFPGKIDDVRIWNIPKTAEQIQQSYNQRLNGNETNLIGYWSFDAVEENINVVPDESPNENVGEARFGAVRSNNTPY